MPKVLERDDTVRVGDIIEVQNFAFILAQVERGEAKLINLFSGNRYTDRNCETTTSGEDIYNLLGDYLRGYIVYIYKKEQTIVEIN